MTTALFAAILTTLLVVSLGVDRREKQRLAGELEAARHVQQLLVSGAKSQAGYDVESVYEPAQEVLVSMMAGVIRSHVDQPPASILAAMNRVLGEGSGGFVTVIAMRCDPFGNLTIAPLRTKSEATVSTRYSSFYASWICDELSAWRVRVTIVRQDLHRLRPRNGAIRFQN